jgi:hypothetical protein
VPKVEPPARARPTALTRAEHGASALRLKPAERHVLNEALRRGEDLRQEVETAVASYGRWLLEAVFDDDTTAALDGKSKNPVWLELVRRAGGPTLRVSRHLLYVAITIAANDKRITDQAWRGLDGARKEARAGWAPSSPRRARWSASIACSPISAGRFATTVRDPPRRRARRVSLRARRRSPWPGQREPDFAAAAICDMPRP